MPFLRLVLLFCCIAPLAHGAVAPFRLTSTAVADGGTLPAVHSADGKNQSPPLAWTTPPDGATAFALIMDDPDAKAVAGETMVHWMLVNLPSDRRGLPLAITSADLPAGTVETRSYDGPQPPDGDRHVYRVALYALKRTLNREEAGKTLTREEFERVFGDIILAKAGLSFAFRQPKTR